MAHVKVLSLILAAIASLVAAQTPPGFNPSVVVSLNISYGANEISPGKLISGQEVANPPNLSVPANMTSSTGKALLFMIDLDVPKTDSRTTLLHWMAPSIDLSQNPAKIPGDGGVPYLQPSPPVGDSAHRYVFVLYHQPKTFNIPTQYENLKDNRIGFNLTSFTEATGLIDPMGANYMTVENKTGNATTTFPLISSMTGSISKPTSSSGTKSLVPIEYGVVAILVMALLY